jgi:histidine decarboxylase
MKGALDNLDRIKAIFEKLCLTHTYIHVDAALSGMILPFVDDPTPWNFASGADSISISGHKLIGSPLPCGVALVKKVLMERISRSVEYVGALDTTISGSRNALTPLILWYALRTNRESGFRTMITHSLSMADYAIDQLARIGIKAWRNPNSITVVFPRPPDAILQEWVLAPFRDICHLITLPSTTTKTIDRFVNDLAQALPET